MKSTVSIAYTLGIFSLLLLTGCCGCLNPNYSADCVESRLVTSEVYQNYPDAAWAQRNACLRADYSHFTQY